MNAPSSQDLQAQRYLQALQQGEEEALLHQASQQQATAVGLPLALAAGLAAWRLERPRTCLRLALTALAQARTAKDARGIEAAEALCARALHRLDARAEGR